MIKDCEKMNLMNNLKNLKTILDTPQVEPYAIEKINSKTGEIERIHILPTCAGGVVYNSYPPYMH